MEEAPPQTVEAHYARGGGMFLTLVHNEEGPDVSDALQAWHDVMRQDQLPSMATGGPGHNVYLFKGPYARDAVQSLAHIARMLNPGGWDVVEGYRPGPAVS